MGWFARWFSKSDTARLDRAKRYLDQQRYNAARLEIDGVTLVGAKEVRDQALKTLAARNIEEAHACLNAGDSIGAQEHLVLARQFGADEDSVRGVRRYGRKVREQARAKAAAEEAARNTVEPMGNDPLWSLAPDDPKLRFALLIESYPATLRAKMAGLGADFADALILLEEGKPKAAYDALTPFVNEAPVARYERARAAIASKQFAAAASDLMTFGDQIGHQWIGKTHSATVLASVLSRLGRGDEALAQIESIMTNDPSIELAVTRTQLLEHLNRLDAAERAAEDLLRRSPREMGVYRQLARIRMRLGKRLAAMHTLEGGLQTCCSSPGSCGNQPLDVVAVRMLTRLYLEDRLDPKRTKELLEKLRHHVTEETWEDRYIQALVSRNDDRPDTKVLARRLMDALKPGDRRANIVKQAFGEMIVA